MSYLFRSVLSGLLGALLLTSCSGGGSGGSSGGVQPVPPGWLYTEGNRIKRADGSIWMGRGANLHDTRSCLACAFDAPNVAEVKRRADVLVNDWGANFVHLVMDSFTDEFAACPDPPNCEPLTHWKNVLGDPAYLQDIRNLVDHLSAKPGVYVLLYLHEDPCLGINPAEPSAHIGAPTAACIPIWEKLAEVFRENPRVLYGIATEPTEADGTDAQIWARYNAIVEAIRDVEDRVRPDLPYHLVAVQGTRNYARELDYYLAHPIAARQGRNIIYETHPYNPAADIQRLVTVPAQTLPVVIGEFGPSANFGDEISLADVSALLQEAERLQVPYLAWSFHPRCPPSLLADFNPGSCGVGTTLTPSANALTPGDERWGTLFFNHLQNVR